MRSVVALVVLCSCLASEASAQVARVTAERTNLRDRPATDGAIVASLARGDELEVLERSGAWFRVRVRSTGREGFVSSLLVETTGAVPTPAAAPAAPAAPPPSTAVAPAVASEPAPTQAFTPAPTQSGRRSIELGARIGLNRSRIDVADNDTTGLRPRMAIAPGGLVRLWLNDRLALQVEALYSPQGERFDQSDVEAVLKLDYLQIPALAMFSFGSGGVRPFVVAGPAVGVRLSAKVEVDEITEDVGEFLTTSDLGLMVGGGIDVGRLTFDVRYLLGLKNLEVEADALTTSKNRVLMVGASIRF